MTAPSPKPGQLIPVIYAETCKGLLYRRRGEFEAVTVDEKSLGIFPDEKSAVVALFDSNPKR